MACFTYIESFHNPLRLHSGLGYRSPIHCDRELPSRATQPCDQPTRTRPLTIRETRSIPVLDCGMTKLTTITRVAQAAPNR